MANLDEDKVFENGENVNSTENLNLETKAFVEDAKAKKEAVQPAKTKKRKGASKIKGTASELKKITWPSFGTVVKNTAIVLSVTAVFLLVIIGIDQLLYLIYDLLTKGM